MKKLLFTLLACVLCLGLVGGAFAYFSDTETSSGNTFTAGTLDLKIDADPDAGEEYWVDDPNVPNVNQLANQLVSNLKPGDSGQVIVLVKNAGTIEGTADIHFKNVTNDPGTTPEPEPTPDNGELGASVHVNIYYNNNLIVDDKTLDQLNSVNYDLGTLAANSTGEIKLVFWIPTTVGNEIMGDYVTFDVEFSLKQPQT